jgi:hypothetical protein
VDRPRYTTKAFPALAGDTVPVSFRCPRPVLERFDAAIAAAEGVANRTDALQDAAVLWTLLEEGEKA